MTNPICCGQEARFVNNGRSLQYFYCEECKKEVEHPDPLLYVQSLSDEDADEFFKRLQQTNLIDPPMDMQEQLRQSLVVSADVTVESLTNIVFDKVGQIEKRKGYSLFEKSAVKEKRGMIFDIHRADLTISHLITLLQTLPPSAILKDVNRDFDDETLEFKVLHESFPVVPEGAMYTRESLDDNGWEENEDEFDQGE